MSKRYFVLIVLVVGIGVGAYLYYNGRSAPAVETETPMENESPVNTEDRVETEAQEEETETGVVREFEVTARQWEFEPSVITVNKGDRVVLRVRSVDVEHGLAVSAFGINESLRPGETVEISFTAGEAGTFPFVCSVYCGSGHGRMRGRIVVEE